MSASTQSTGSQSSDYSSISPPAQASIQGQSSQPSTSRLRTTTSTQVQHNPQRASGDPYNSSTVPIARGQDTESRRLSLIAADRKRRLTDSAQGPLRRRTNSGGFTTQDARLSVSPGSPDVERLNTAPIHTVLMRNMSSSRQNSMDEAQQHNLQRRPSATGRTECVLPPWQPDSEVSRCPICESQFTWYFRKHHCRKCGRVVCANCSPHRITIPRQFIVHPPYDNQQSQSTNIPISPAIIDLTEDSPESTARPVSRRQSSMSTAMNPGLGGGEEVRLCNPCVPDPQPQPESAYPSSARAGRGSRGPSGSDFRSSWESYQRQRGLPREDHTTAWLAEQARQELRRQRGRGMIVSRPKFTNVEI